MSGAAQRRIKQLEYLCPKICVMQPTLPVCLTVLDYCRNLVYLLDCWNIALLRTLLDLNDLNAFVQDWCMTPICKDFSLTILCCLDGV